MAPHVTLEWIGAPYEAVRVQYGAKQLLPVNPAGVVPTLREDDGWLLTQAGAIPDYLAAKHPVAGLAGGDSLSAKAEAHRCSAFFTSDVHASFWPIFMPQRYKTDESEAARQAVIEAGHISVAKRFGIFDRHLDAREDILDGGRSVIDAYAFPMIRWAGKLLPGGLTDHPNVRTLHDRIAADPAVRKVLAREVGQVTTGADKGATSGLHHVTGITADVQANVDFYAGFLGLRLVKRTGGYADAEQLHLIYGDGLGSPGSLLTFLVWEATGRGRTGIGQVSEVALAVAPVSLGDWLTRALAANVPSEGPSREFGEPVLRLKDPDGLIVKLVGIDMPTPAPLPDAPARLRGITLLTHNAAETAEFLTRFGYRHSQHADLTQRLVSDTDVVDVREVSGFVPSVPGAGVPDHVAFRAQDADAVRSMRRSLEDHGPTEVHDRKYFLSLYVRDPAGILMEYATDGPGMSVDEAPEDLGRTLFLPPQDAGRADDLKAMLPQFAMPGEERFPVRDLPFIHRFNRPERPDGTTLVLLHGAGGNEADLMPMARRIAPHATLLGVRGRAIDEETGRWFRRMDASTFDQADLRGEAEAFAAFVDGAVTGYGLDPSRLAFLGYSNGANLLAAVIQLHPSVVRRAILLRGIQPFENPPATALSGTRVLMLDGRDDPLVRSASTLADDLRTGGARVESKRLSAGHELSGADVTETAEWIGGNLPGAAPAEVSGPSA